MRRIAASTPAAGPSTPSAVEPLAARTLTPREPRARAAPGEVELGFALAMGAALELYGRVGPDWQGSGMRSIDTPRAVAERCMVRRQVAHSAHHRCSARPCVVASFHPSSACPCAADWRVASSQGSGELSVTNRNTLCKTHIRVAALTEPSDPVRLRRSPTSSAMACWTD
jgi:hypothetical protein